MQSVITATISRKISLLLVFILLTSFVPSLTPHTLVLRLSLHHASLSDDPSIDVLGVAWADVNLKVLVVKPSWLSKSYVDSVVKAFKAWDRSLESFGNSYGYPYLSKFSFYVTISSTSRPGYDITVEFSRVTAQPGGEIGEAIVAYVYGRIVSVRIILYVYTINGKLSSVDVFNIALHEIGHALGLNHASSSSTINGPELMYPTYSYPKMELRPSTLDAYALAEVYAWLARGSFAPPSKRTISLPSSIPYRILLYYRVTVISEYGNVSGGGWYLEGAIAKVKIDSPVVTLEEGVRAVFEGWSGDIRSENTTITFRVDRDIEVKALWGIEYFVNISAGYANASARSGWYKENTELDVTISSSVVYLDGYTRAIFTGWSGDVNSTSLNIVLVVDRPLNIFAKWRLQYWIEIDSVYSIPLNQSGWYNSSDKLIVGVKEPILDLGNRTRLVIRGWTGTLNLSEPKSELNVSSPLKLKAIWVREYFVEIISAYSNVSIRSGWYEENQLINISVIDKVVDQGNDTRRVFWFWLVNGEGVNAYSLLLKVNSSLKIFAKWRTQYLVSVNTLGQDGNSVSTILLISQKDSTVKINTSKTNVSYWLYKGSWRINFSSCKLSIVKGYVGSLLFGRKKVEGEFLPCNSLTPSFRAERPGRIDIILNVQNVTLVCKDFLGIPSPFYTITFLNKTLTCDFDGFAASLRIPQGNYSVYVEFPSFRLYSTEVTIRNSGGVVVHTPVSLYPVLFVMASVIMLFRKYTRQRHSKVSDENV